MVSIAVSGTIIILGLFLLIHGAVMAKWLPYSLVWGSRVKSVKEMYRLKVVSIVLIGFFLGVVLQKASIIPAFLPEKVVYVVFWVMAILFAFNTVGNLLSKNKVEKYIFTFFALLLSCFCFIIAWNE